MVYRGKPSKGCAECRAKKTRCDAARPSCGQCRRLGRKCSGYRNLDDLRFLNQTSTVKAKHASSVKSSSSDDWSAPTTPPSPVSSEESTSPSSLAVSRPIIVNPFSWDLGAHTVFFRQYVHAATGPSKTEMNWVIPIFGQAKSSGPLSDIVAALGLVALVGAGSDPSIRRLAAQKYSSSLKKTHLALRDDVEAKSDETMATIILLALHEVGCVLQAYREPSANEDRRWSRMTTMVPSKTTGFTCTAPSVYVNCVGGSNSRPPSVIAFGIVWHLTRWVWQCQNLFEP